MKNSEVIFIEQSREIYDSIAVTGPMMGAINPHFQFLNHILWVPANPFRRIATGPNQTLPRLTTLNVGLTTILVSMNRFDHYYCLEKYKSFIPQLISY